MGYDQYTVPDPVAVKTTFYCFPFVLANICPWPLVLFFQISLKNSELKTTHNTFLDCCVHFFRQPFSKQLYTQVLCLYIRLCSKKKLKDAQCSKPVKSRVLSMGFLLKRYDFLVTLEQKIRCLKLPLGSTRAQSCTHNICMYIAMHIKIKCQW